MSIQDVIGHIGRYFNPDNDGDTVTITGQYELYIVNDTNTILFGQPTNTDKVTTCSVVISNTDSSAITPSFHTTGGVNARLMTNIEAIPTGQVAEYVGTYIPTIGWLINGGTQRSVIQSI